MFRILNRFNFSKKMLMIFFGSVFIPMILQNYFFFAHTKRDLEVEMKERLMMTLMSNQLEVSRNLGGIISLMRNYSKDMQIHNYLNDTYVSDLEYFNTYNTLKTNIVEDISYHLQIRDIKFITDNPTVFNGGYVLQASDYESIDKDNNVLNVVSDENQKIKYFISTVENKTNSTIEHRIKMRKQLDEYNQLFYNDMYVQVELNLQYLSSLLDEIGFFERIFVMDEEGRILITSGTYKEVSTYEIFDESSLDRDMNLYSSPVEGTPFTICGIYKSSTILDQFNIYRINNLVIATIGIGFAALLIFIIGVNTSKRMNKIVHVSQEIAKGNFVTLEHNEKDDDELGELEKSINEMSQQLEVLIEKEYQSKILQVKLEKEGVKAKLHALQSQVNPHFLFNALESIRLKAMVNNEKETAKTIKHMARMFRNLITWDRDIIWLEEEVLFLEEFLNIQKYRFEDEFSYELEVSEEARTCLIPKMLIQPLVENACIHGTKFATDLFCVKISGEIVGNRLQVTVTDNGGGMTLERLKEVKRNLDNENDYQSVGLYNVYQRLKLYYDGDFNFDILSNNVNGTKCIIKIPVQKSQEMNNLR